MNALTGNYAFHCKLSMLVITKTGPLYADADLEYSFRPGGACRPVWGQKDPRLSQKGPPIFLEVSKGKYLVALTEFLPPPERIFFGGRSIADVYKDLSRLRAKRRLNVADYPVLVAMIEKNGKLNVERVLPGELDDVFGQKMTLEFLEMSIRPNNTSRRGKTVPVRMPAFDFSTLAAGE